VKQQQDKKKKRAESHNEPYKTHIETRITYLEMRMEKMSLAKRFGSIAHIQVQPDLTSNGQINQKIISDLLFEVTLKITKQ